MTKPGPYKRRVPRSHRRVMLVLLPEGPGLTAHLISRAAMVRSGTVYKVLNKLERAGWVTGRREGLAADGAVAEKWFNAPLPPRWHRCRTVQSGHISTGAFYERCACGAIRRDGSPWLDRNSRRKAPTA